MCYVKPKALLKLLYAMLESPILFAYYVRYLENMSLEQNCLYIDFSDDLANGLTILLVHAGDRYIV